MKDVLTTFASQYRLGIPEVMEEIECVFSDIYSRWYGFEVMVFFQQDFHLEAVAYDKRDGAIAQRVIDPTNVKGRRTLKKHLEKRLATVSLLKQTRNYKFYEREMRWGEITGSDSENNLYVEIEMVDDEKITALCPLNRIGVHERDSEPFIIGHRRAFHIRRVEPVSLCGTGRLKVIVDRVSKTLVEELLKEQLPRVLEQIHIRCTHRYVGQKSFVLSSKRLPKAAIGFAAKELGEHIQVRFIGNC